MAPSAVTASFTAREWKCAPGSPFGWDPAFKKKCKKLEGPRVTSPQQRSLEGTFYYFSFGTFEGDLSEWDVSYIWNFKKMLAYSTGFKWDLSSWKAWNLAHFDDMFKGMDPPFEGDLSLWSFPENFTAQGLADAKRVTMPEALGLIEKHQSGGRASRFWRGGKCRDSI